MEVQGETDESTHYVWRPKHAQADRKLVRI
jgi:hypothetical protein